MLFNTKNGIIKIGEKMSLYDKMLNISNKNIEEEIKNAILETKDELKGLDVDRMCKIYSSYLYENLKKRHVLAHIIDTKDLGFSFQHRFILVYYKVYYLIDLTYSQFNNNNILFSKLLNNGYQIIDNNTLMNYLKIISNENMFVNIEEIFIKK